MRGIYTQAHTHTPTHTHIHKHTVTCSGMHTEMQLISTLGDTLRRVHIMQPAQCVNWRPRPNASRRRLSRGEDSAECATGRCLAMPTFLLFQLPFTFIAGTRVLLNGRNTQRSGTSLAHRLTLVQVNSRICCTRSPQQPPHSYGRPQ